MFRLLFTSVALATLISAQSLAALVVNDSTGDVIVPGSPFPHLDITSVAVSNTATDLVFTINLDGNPVATDWGKYMVGIDSVPASGDPAGDGWVRPIGMSSGMDYWLGSWVDGGNGMELRTYSGGVWSLQAASYNAIPPLATPTKNASSVTLTVPLAYMGLGIGSTICFDVYTSGGGGGDGAVDALNNPNPSIANWGDYYNSGNLMAYYTVEGPAPVPEPGTFFVWGLILGVIGLVVKRMKAV